MNQPILRKIVFTASSALLAVTLSISLWRHAHAAEVKAGGETAEKLSKVCESVANVDSAKLEQVLKLAAALDSQNPEHRGWMNAQKIDALATNISQLSRSLGYLNDQLDRLSASAINDKVSALPGLTEACLAAVTSSREAVEAISKPIADMHSKTNTFTNEMSTARDRLTAYRGLLIEAARTPHESHLNDLAMQDLFGCDVAIIGSETEVIDQSERNDFYRRVLTETNNLEWLTLKGDRLEVSPDLLGMDIVVRNFTSDETTCHTTLIRFSHGESIRVPQGTTRIVALFCKPERMKKSESYSREENGVRFIGKQMIVIPTR